jgi:DNA mismatch repair protein MutS
MAVREHGGKVHFLRSVEDGAADKSYGIHVAELAGIPAGVVDRARDLLNELETRREGLAHAPASGQPRQAPLFGSPPDGMEEEVLAVLRAARPDKMTPLQALLLIERRKN